MKALQFTVSGRVQGVWFRAWTEGVARRLGLTGWVRNLPDGRVEGFAEGPEGALETLLERLHEGPPAARVDAVQVEWTEPEGHTTFEVRH